MVRLKPAGEAAVDSAAYGIHHGEGSAARGRGVDVVGMMIGNYRRDRQGRGFVDDLCRAERVEEDSRRIVDPKVSDQVKVGETRSHHWSILRHPQPGVIFATTASHGEVTSKWLPANWERGPQLTGAGADRASSRRYHGDAMGIER